MKRINKKIILFLILLIAIALRFWQLGNVPHSINGDQLHYLFNAESFLYSGLDATQTKGLGDIFMFRYPEGDAVQAELPFIISIFTVGIFANTLFNAFFVYAFLGVLIVLLLYLITKNMINEPAALMAAFIAATNPWFIFISRTSYEMIPATFFWLCFIYSLLVFKGSKIMLSFIFFALAFYSYIGTKLIAIPLAILVAVYVYFFINKKKYIKQYLMLTVLITAFVGFFVFQLLSASGTSRVTDIINPSDPIFADTVDAVRKNTIQSFFLDLFENKVTVLMMTLLSNYMNIISPSYLFLNGDYFMSLGQFGIFNPLDIVLLIFGTFALFKFNKKLLGLLYLLIFISFIPQIVHKNNNAFTPHILLAIPFLIIIFSASMLAVKSKIKNRWILIFIMIFGLLYIFNTGRFLNIYFYRMPLQNDFFNLPNRIMSKYIDLAGESGRGIIVFSNNSKDLYKEYIFYNDFYTRDNASVIANNLINKNYIINNIQFRSCDSFYKNTEKEIVVVKSQCDMNIKGSSYSISNLSDGGWVYRIYNDRICRKYELYNYPRDISLNDFDIDGKEEERFCEKFIVDPNIK